MANLIHKLRQLIRGVAGKSEAAAKPKLLAKLPPLPEVLDEKVVMQLMRMIEKTNEEEYSCEDTFALLDEYVERIANHENAAALMPLVKHHLEMCVDCREQFETLLNVIQAASPPPTG